LSEDKNVKEAVCGAISYLVRNVDPDQLAGQPALLIVQAFSNTVSTFTGTTLISFFDCIGTLSETLGDHLQDKALVELLMPLLASKWNVIQD